MLISVVMAVFNGELYLQSAIDSILGQTYENFELVIVNDGSIDKTKEILDSVTDSRVKIIHLKKNAGAANALNMGVENAKGEWIAIHDADDISEANKLKELVKYIKAHPESIGVGSLINCFTENTFVKNTMLENEESYYNMLLDDTKVYNERLFKCYLCHGSVLFSKKLFSEIGGYNTKFKICYDYDLWLRMFDHQIIQKVPKVLYNYRFIPNSLGKSSSSQTSIELQTIVSDYIYESLKQTLGREPVFVVMGSKKGCLLFRETIQEKQNLKIEKYISYNRRTVAMALNQTKNTQADAILLLNSKYANHILSRLLRMGLKFNENVFLIWNRKS